METAAPLERGRAAPWAPRSALARVATILAVVLAIIAVSVVQRASATEPAIPPWLAAHIGEDNGQITQVVLERARALYLQKVAAGVVRNPCYFAMDATRPNTASDGTPGLRFYIVCEASRRFARSRRATAPAATGAACRISAMAGPARRTSATPRARA